MTAMNLVVLLALGGAFAAMGLFSLGVALARERPPIRPTPSSMSAVGACIAMGVLSVLVGAHDLREALAARPRATPSRAPAGGQSPTCTAEDDECFQLWNGCEPVQTAVTVTHVDGDIDSDVDPDLTAAVVKGLREVGIEADFAGHGARLSVDVRVFPSPVGVTEAVFIINSGFWKEMRDPDGRNGWALTWPPARPRSFVAPWKTPIGDGGFVSDLVSLEAAGFALKFLEVNGPACETRRGDEL